MRYLLLVIGPYKSPVEAWIPYWINSSSAEEASEQAKEIAFSIYRSGEYPPEMYQFELFVTDSILPAIPTNTWLEEYKSRKT